MLRLLARLILIPLGLVFGALGAAVVLLLAPMVQPEVAGGVSEAVQAALEGLFNAIAAEDDVRLLRFGESALGLSRLVVVVLLLPVALTAAVCEVFGLRSLTLQVGLTALLTVLVPMAALPGVMVGSGIASPFAALLAAAGGLAGFLYWVIAGQGAARPRPSLHERIAVPAPEREPKPSARRHQG